MSAYLNGGFGRNWTTDTRIFSPLLYRLSYEAKKMAVPTGVEPAIFCVTGRRDNHYTTEPFGCGGWIWTNDLWVMSPTSYQAAPLRDINKNGGERGIRTPAPFPTSRFSRPVPSTRLGYSSNNWCLRSDLNRHEGWISQDFKSCASTYSATQAHFHHFFQVTTWLYIK